jgi:hypothetical protein
MNHECICEHQPVPESWLHEFMCPLYVTEEVARDADRYRWLRQNPAFETEAFLGGLTPEQFDTVVDRGMKP